MGAAAGLMTVAGLYGSFLAIGWLTSRKAKGGTSDLILAGRSMPLWLAVMTMTATWVDGGYLLGTVEGAFKEGGGLALGLQGGICFGLSLVLGGLLFAKRMRSLAFTTLGDPFEARFGRRWAAVLCLPAVLGEMIWSAELLVSTGATLGAMLGMDLRLAILLAASVVVLYTMLGGLWSVAYTDTFQLALVPLGLLVALPFVLGRVGGLGACATRFFVARAIEPAPGALQRLAFWDTSLMLVFGGIPWNCYFQRVLSCKDPETARRHSYIAGALTMALTLPPLLLGMAAFSYPWEEAARLALARNPSMALPMLLRAAAPFGVGLLGLGAIIGACTSSFSASVLSAASMLGWNVYGRLLKPGTGEARLRAVVRAAVVALGACAAAMALSVRSVQELWFLTSDLVFVLLVPQLFSALFDPKANRVGSIAAFAVSLALRAICPFKTLACLAGAAVLPLVSRLTAQWDAPSQILSVPSIGPEGNAC